MRFDIEDNRRDPVTGILGVTSRLEHTKMEEIIVEQEGFQFVGDPEFTKRFLARATREREKMEQAAKADPDLADRLVMMEELARELEQSLDEDPTDTKGNWDEAQLQMRQEVRRKKRKELLGEDLPSAHQDLIKQVREHAEYMGPYEIIMNDDQILVLGELTQAWCEKNLKRQQATAATPEEDEDSEPAPTVPSLDTLIAGIIMEMLNTINRTKDRIREKKLIKTRTKSRRR